MPRLPGINHLIAVKALQKIGFQAKRQSKHIIMSNGKSILVIPRNNPLRPLTMGAIIQDAGLTVDEFKKLL